MKLQNQPFYVRLLVAGGLLMVTLPTLFKEYIPMSDFLRGFLIGLGLTLEIFGLIAIGMKKATWCRLTAKFQPEQKA